jgi:hypothetical protein
MSGEIRFTNVEVVRTHKGGFTIVSNFRKADGTVGKSYVKIWSQLQANEGEVLSIIGEPSARISEYTDKQGEHKIVAELHVNNATIVKADAPF